MKRSWTDILRRNAGLASNLASMLAWQAGNYLVPLLIIPFLARKLHPEAFGIYSFVFALMMTVTVLVEWGFPLLAVKELSISPKAEAATRRYINSVLAAKAAIFIAVAIVLLVLSDSHIHLLTVSQGIMVISLGLPLGSVLSVGWVLQSYNRLTLFAVSALVGRLSTLPLTVLLVKQPSDLWKALLVQSFGSIIAALSAFVVARHADMLGTELPSPKMVAARIVSGFDYFLSSAAINIYTSMSAIILGFTRGPEAVAMFAGPDRVKAAAQNIVAPLSQTFFPRMTAAFVADPDQAKSHSMWLIIVFGLLGAGASLLIFALAAYIIPILLGSGYHDSIKVLRILSLVPFLSATSNATSLLILVPAGYSTQRTRVLIGVTVISIPLMYFGSSIGGASGLAMALVIAEALGAISFGYLVMRNIYRLV